MPVPTQPTLLNLRERVLNLLNEANNTQGGAQPSGTGGVVTSTTTEYLTLKLNEAKNILTREAWPVEGQATVTFPAGKRSLIFAAMSTADGSAVINCLEVYGPDGLLTLADRSHISINTMPGSTAKWINATGAARYWYRSGGAGIGLAPFPSADTALTLDAYLIPPDMVADTDTPAWLTTDLSRLLVFYAAYQYCRKNTGDNKLDAMIEGWMSEFERGKQILQNRFYAADPALAMLLIGVSGPAGK